MLHEVKPKQAPPLPIVDLKGGKLKDPEIANALHVALRDRGFLYIANCGIDASL